MTVAHLAHGSAGLPLARHWIGGAPFAGSSDRTGDVYDPALGIVATPVAFPDHEEGVALINTGAFGDGTAILTDHGGVDLGFPRN